LLGFQSSQKPKTGKSTTALGKATIPRWTVKRSAGPVVPNSVRLTNNTDVQTVDQPVTFARFFAVGEFPASVAAQIGDTVLPTQCDVKTRWPDGSLQHVVLTFRTTIEAQGSVEVSFVQADNPADGGGLSAEDMLSDAYELGAQIALTSGDTTKTVSVRDLLANGNFRYWLNGPLCTQVIVEERSESPEFDIGFNDYKSFHPIFVVTFYPGSRGVRVEFIGENAWITREQDIDYSLAIRTGSPLADTPVYTKPNYKHVARSRWRKVFWSGPAIPQPNIDHNLPYLIYARALPNYDLSRSVDQQYVKNLLEIYRKGDKGDLGGHCLYTQYFPQTGGRGELGIFSTWDVYYLYTFSPETAEMTENCSAVSAQIPIHTRESVAGKQYSAVFGPDGDALGRPVSIDARPRYCSREPGCSEGVDDIKPVGKTSTAGWGPDTAHQGSFAFIPYLLSGDPFWLDEIHFWSAFNLSVQDPGDCFYCRGEQKEADTIRVFGVMHPCSNCRAFGWQVRTVAHAALMAPDGTPEKAYFTDKLLNTIAVHEGRLQVTDGLVASDPSRQPIWDFGRKVMDFDRPNPLSIWCVSGNGNVGSDDPFVDYTKGFYALSPWMQHIILINLGYVEDMGFPVKALRQKAYQFMLGELTSPDYNPYLVAAYTMPASPSADVYFQSWGGIKEAFLPIRSSITSFAPSTDTDFGYNFIALGTAAYLVDVEQDGRKGIDAYNWLKAEVPNQFAYSANPKWAIIPREIPTQGSVSNPESWSRPFRALGIGRSGKK
jgi:hypothetical protein